MSWIADHAKFAGAFVRDWRTTGSLVPSSRWLAAEIVRDAGLSAAATVVEAGAGTGSFTPFIRRAVPPGALVLAVELNPGLAARLEKNHPDVRVVAGSIEHLKDQLAAEGREAADCVVSSLPWASLAEPLQERLLTAIAGSLRFGGTFVTYAYLQAQWMTGAKTFRRMLGGHFSFVTRSRVVWRNIPPAFVYRCRR